MLMEKRFGSAAEGAGECDMIPVILLQESWKVLLAFPWSKGGCLPNKVT